MDTDMKKYLKECEDRYYEKYIVAILEAGVDRDKLRQIVDKIYSDGFEDSADIVTGGEVEHDDLRVDLG